MKKELGILSIASILGVGCTELRLGPEMEQHLCLWSSEQIIKDLDSRFNNQEGEMKVMPELPSERGMFFSYLESNVVVSHQMKMCMAEQLYKKGYILHKFEKESSGSYRLVIERLPEV